MCLTSDGLCRLLPAVLLSAATRMRLNVALSHDSGFQFQPHPNVSKSLWKSGILALKDPSRTFPVGTAVSLLRWRHLSRDESSLPLSRSYSLVVVLPTLFQSSCDCVLAASECMA